ncbi:MAG: helix-turn-helix domain-containing protein [Phycisphaerales bacterium JB039]
MSRDADYASIVQALRRLPSESEWVEFKCNYAAPDDIGEYISALANSAATAHKPHAYVIWGIADESHDVIGTTFRPSRARKGNEELENWLLRQLISVLRCARVTSTPAFNTSVERS